MPPKTRPTTRKSPAKRKTPRRKRVTVRSPIKVVLFRCRRCKLTTNNPFARIFHTCMQGFTASQKTAIRERTAAQTASARRNLQTARKARKG